MARNGSGGYSKINTFSSGASITASGHNQNWDDLATEMTNSVAADGQTTMTGALKGSNGTVSLPAYSFASDLDTGAYRIGANNYGIAVNGTKIVDVATTGLSVVGTLAASGAFSPADQILGAAGTVLLPEYSFTLDPDCGMYRIGANNIGVAVNAAKVLDISTTGLNVVGTILQNGSALAQAAFATGMINGTIAESHTGNAVTFALKTAAGTDPSSTDPVIFLFRNATAATGDYATIQVTAAMSLVISSGSTMGFTSGVAGRLWLVMFNDAGTARMGAINCLSGTSIYPLGQFPIASSTAEGGAGAADSAQVFYTGTAVTSKAYVPIAYASYETGVATAGNWAASPTRIQLYSHSGKLPGDVIQTPRNATGTVATGSTAIPADNTIPQNTEGDQYMSQAITPTSAANVLEISHVGAYTATTSVYFGVALFQDSVANALAATVFFNNGGGNNQTVPLEYTMISGTTSSTTFKIRAGGSSGTATFNGSAGVQQYGGVLGSYLRVREVMA